MITQPPDLVAITTAIVAQLQKLLPEMTPEQRLIVFSEVSSNYCSECGKALGYREVCRCWDNE